MSLEALFAQLLPWLVTFIVPVAGGWAWRTESRFTALATVTAERKEAEDEWKRDLKERLTRIENKVDNVRRPDQAGPPPRW